MYVFSLIFIDPTFKYNLSSINLQQKPRSTQKKREREREGEVCDGSGGRQSCCAVEAWALSVNGSAEENRRLTRRRGEDRGALVVVEAGLNTFQTHTKPGTATYFDRLANQS
jgi:hypothetical protein